MGGLTGYLVKVGSKAVNKWATKNAAVSPKLEAYGKELTKHGSKAFENSKDWYGKCLADDRLNHMLAPPFRVTKENHEQLVHELAKDEHVRLDYLQSLLKAVNKKDEVRSIIRYVKSTAANNLSPDDRAHLLSACLEKLKYVDLIAQFLH